VIHLPVGCQQSITLFIRMYCLLTAKETSGSKKD
jgi:hypothetical protein